MRLVAVAVVVLMTSVACADSTPTATPPTTTEAPATTTEATASPLAACTLEEGGQDRYEETVSPDEVALLADVGTEPEGCPQVVFTFENTLPDQRVEYREPPFVECGSGEEIDTSEWGADAFITVHLEPASGVDQSGTEFREVYDGPADIEVDGEVLTRVRRTCDFEATMEWVIALTGPRDFVVSGAETEIVIDISEAASSD